MAYTLSWDETVPLGSAAANTIDDLFRALKRDLRERQADFFDLPSASAASYAVDPLRPYGIKFTSLANSTIYLGLARSLLIKDSTGVTTYLTQSATQLTLGSTIDFVITATKKLYLDTGVDTYLYEISGNVIAFVAGTVNSVSINSTGLFFTASSGDNIQGNGAGTVKIQTGSADRLTLVNTTSVLASALNVTGGDIIFPAQSKLRVDGSAAGDTYLLETAANQLDVFAGGVNTIRTTATLVSILGVDFNIPATKKLYIDGGGDTYLIETSANQVDLFAGAVNTFRSITTAVSILSVDLIIPSGKKFRLDGNAAGDTYIDDGTNDRVSITCGGDNVGLFRSVALGNIFTLSGTAGATVFNVASAGAISIKAAVALYLDGGNDTYITGEVVANTINLVCNSTTAFSVSVVGANPDTQLGSSTTTASAANLRMASTGLQSLLVNTSLRAVKTNIHDITLEEARRLMFGFKPIFFTSLCKEDDPDIIHPGLIAEEVVLIDPRFATYYKGRLTSVYYERLAVPLYLIVKDHESRLERLEKECLPGS